MIIRIKKRITRVKSLMTWHQDYGSASILGPSAKELRQKPRRNCRRLVKVKVRALGGRRNVFDSLCTSPKDADVRNVSILLVDSEEAVTPGTSPWNHVLARK